MKILVIGTWHPEVAKKYEKQAEELGKLLAEKGHILVTSPSSGVQGYVAKYYRKYKGKKIIGYYPDLKLMEEVGEKVMIEPDEKIMTKQDYPIRNILQIKSSEAVIALPGKMGTFMEALNALMDYKLPTAVFIGSDLDIDKITELSISKNPKLFTSNNIKKLVEFVEKQ